MNRKAEADFGDYLRENLAYLLLLVIFSIGMFLFVGHERNSAAVWEDYYAKELVRIIDSSQAGDVVSLDVLKATEIAQKNQISSFSEIFLFDNVEHEVCVHLYPERSTCYSFFNSVDVVDYKLVLDVPGNQLSFNIAKHHEAV